MRIHLPIPEKKSLGYGLLQGWKAGDILLLANAVSALKCTRLGGRAGIPRPAEVRTFLDARGQGNFLDPS